MITLNFYTLAEKTPKHKESIIYLDKVYSFDSYGFQPREINVEYSWELVESDGTHCGVSVCYEESDPTPPELSEEEIADGCMYELVILAEDQYMDENSLWSPAEEFWESFTGKSIMEKANQNPKSLPDWDKQDEIVRYLNDPGSYASSQSPKLNVGDFWYIKYPGATALFEVEIKEVSSKTVVLMQVDNRYIFSGARYEISDIKFVEKVEKV